MLGFWCFLLTASCTVYTGFSGLMNSLKTLGLPSLFFTVKTPLIFAALSVLFRIFLRVKQLKRLDVYYVTDVIIKISI